MRRAVLVIAMVAGCLGWLTAQTPRTAIFSRLLWFDRHGNRLGGIGPVADHGNLEISPDGKRVAVAVTDRALGTRDIWLYDLDDDQRTRFTSDPADENWMIWSPDGMHVLLNSFSRQHLQLLERPSAGASPATLILDGGDGAWPVSWSPDGRVVLYVTNNERTSNDIWVLPLDGTRKPYPFLQTAAQENWATFSPDGHWVAYSVTASGQPEAFVSRFPNTGERWRISADGGTQARWRRDGKEIVYVAPNRSLMSASISHGEDDSVVVSDYDALFELAHPYGAYHAFDMTADGQRFLVNTLVVDPAGGGLIASLH